jgi:hypothetical protein
MSGLHRTSWKLFLPRGIQARRMLPLAVLSSLALTGCVELARSARVANVCTPEAARSAGESDARAGKPPREGYANICGVAEASLNRMYADAYATVPETERAQQGFLQRLLH